MLRDSGDKNLHCSPIAYKGKLTVLDGAAGEAKLKPSSLPPVGHCQPPS